MNNKIACHKCNHLNDTFEMNCSNCGTILRGRVSNIDLWETIWQLVESPVEAFKKIVYSEHKNFITFLVILGAFKYFLLSNFIFNLVVPAYTYEYNLVLQAFISIGVLFLFLSAFSFLQKYIHSIFGINTRIKDNFSVLTYSLIPLIISLIILFPVEYGIFGGHWIYFNPSPFFIKFSSAIILSAVELLFLLWHIFLLIIGNYVQTGKTLYSSIWGVIIALVLIIFMAILPAYLVILL